MSDILAFITECWLPLALAAAFGLALYHLGRASGRRSRPSLAERARRYRAESFLSRM
jgi:hypothetical protein